jgi:hypothetical protein
MATYTTNGGLAKRFCTQCGTPLDSEDKFCASCGRPVKAPAAAAAAPVVPTAAPAAPIAAPVTSPVTPAAPPAQPSSEAQPMPQRDIETVTGAVQVVRRKNMFSFETFHLILTSKRMIFAAFTNDIVKQAAREAGQTGFFSGLVGAATIGFTYYKKYLTMDPEAVLRENPQNFALQRSNIRKVKLEMGSRHRDPKTRHETWDESKLDIETTTEKYSFRVPHQLHDQAQAVLNNGG